MEGLREVVGSALLIGGVLLAVVAGVGLVRFPDLFSRMHAATKPATLGTLLVVLGGVVLMDDPGDRAALLLVGAFQMLTNPVAGHMLGRAGYRAGVGALDDLVVDELKDAPPSDDRAGPSP